jgi:hypothetical protein
VPSRRVRGACGIVTTVALLAAGGVVPPASAQTAVQRRAATLAALLTYPAFYQGQPVLIRATLATKDGGPELTSETVERPVHAIFRNPAPPDGHVEIRGEFWDIGRLDRDDPRVDSLRLRSVVETGDEDYWPRPGEVFALVVSDASPAAPFGAVPTLREVVLEPERYTGQKVSVTGQFRGRNLYGDLPQSPGVSSWDFVLRSADAAVWATGQRPRGPGFDLDVGARSDTGHWLRVTGTVREGKGVVWIETTQVAASKPAAETAAAEPAPKPVVGPDAEVIFSDPSEGETDVAVGTQVRIQFSRDMNPETLMGRVQAGYVREDPQAPPVPEPPIQAAWRYDPANRSVVMKFAGPLSRYRLVRIAINEGVTATDGAPLKPWMLTFRVGGR